MHHMQTCGLPDDELAHEHYLVTYGATLQPADESPGGHRRFLAYVHDLPLSVEADYARTCTQLTPTALDFRNSDADHAQRVMNILGVSDCFEGVGDIHAIEFISSQISRLTSMPTHRRGSGPGNCVYLDDSAPCLPGRWAL
jgi:putative hydrolase of the HAD superfamily